jgi:hypothetical protein
MKQIGMLTDTMEVRVVQRRNPVVLAAQVTGPLRAADCLRIALSGHRHLVAGCDNDRHVRTGGLGQSGVHPGRGYLCQRRGKGIASKTQPSS